MNRKLLLLSVLLLGVTTASAQSGTVVFRETGFPAADSVPAPESLLQHALPNAQFASTAELKERLNSAELLVLPYGSAFPEDAWPDIYSFLQRGGNLLVLGGRPFTRAAYRDGGAWKLRDYSVRYTRPLLIDQYQDTPGSDDLKFESNPDIQPPVPQFSWKHGYSPIIHLSAVDLYNRGGSAGSIDSNLDALAWGTKDGRRMSAPVIQIDHLRNGFDGGRWIFVDAELSSDFYNGASASEVIPQLADQALQGAEEFTVRPTLPLYLPGEPIELNVQWNGTNQQRASVAVTVSAGEPQPGFTPVGIPLPLKQPLVFPSSKEKGLHIVEARLLVDGKVRKTYHSAFWIRDEDYLRSG